MLFLAPFTCSPRPLAFSIRSQCVPVGVKLKLNKMKREKKHSNEREKQKPNPNTERNESNLNRKHKTKKNCRTYSSLKALSRWFCVYSILFPARFGSTNHKRKMHATNIILLFVCWQCNAVTSCVACNRFGRLKNKTATIVWVLGCLIRKAFPYMFDNRHPNRFQFSSFGCIVVDCCVLHANARVNTIQPNE